MKTFELQFGSRLKLVNILASASGKTLGELDALMEVFKKVQFSEEDSKQINITTEGLSENEVAQGRRIFKQPNPEFGKISVTIEDAQAEVLAYELKSVPKLDMSDYIWINKLKDDLTGK